MSTNSDDGAAPEIVDLSGATKLRREQVRAGKDFVRLVIVVALFVIFGGTILGAFLGAMLDNGHNWSQVKPLLDLLLPAETALLGVAVAFYMTD